jgi:capsular exopolysaccharide synthesis family protein
MTSGQNLNIPKREHDDFDLHQFLGRYLRYWYLFVISLVLSLGIAYFYNWYKNPVFAISAKLMIKDENAATEKLLQQISIEKPSKNIENEIEILRSYNIMAKVLNELEFDVSYYLIGDLKKSEVYKDCPFRISAEQLPYAAYFQECFVQLIDTNGFIFTIGKSENTIQGRWGVPFDAGAGEMVMTRRENFPYGLLLDPDYHKLNYSIKFNTIGYNQNKYLSRLGIALARPQSTILQVYIEDEVPQKGLDLVNKLLEVYLDNDVDEKNRAASATADFLDKQLTSISQDLEAIETNRERYKVDKGIIDLQSESQMVLESIREIDIQKAQNGARLGLVGQLERYVSQNQDLRDLAPAALDISDPLLVKLINKLSELQSQREIIINRSTINDPALVPLNAEIELTRSSLLESIRNIQKVLQRKDNELNESIREYKGRIQRIPTTERELLEIERRFRIQESLFLFLLQKRAELSITLAATKSDTRLVDSARLMPGPVAPIPAKAYSIALILGLLLPLIFIFGKEKFDDKVKDLSTVRRLLSFPIIGVVHYSKEDSPLISINKPRSGIAEEYRSIRTNLGFMTSQGGTSKIIMVTSSISTEGKTYTAINLAAILALAGHKVVLVGLDLRKPRIVEHFGISNAAGCSTYLSNSSTIDEIIFPSGFIDTLSVVPSGPVPPNPSELINSVRMKLLLDELSQRFDKIIIDTPPIGLVSDGFILAPLADTVAFIVREGVSRKEHLKNLNELAATGKLPNPGIVYNAAGARNTRYGYSGNYNSSYGYGKEYGSYFDDDDAKV